MDVAGPPRLATDSIRGDGPRADAAAGTAFGLVAKRRQRKPARYLAESPPITRTGRLPPLEQVPTSGRPRLLNGAILSAGRLQVHDHSAMCRLPGGAPVPPVLTPP
ncbi:hypothetical protein EGT29_14265 [Pigmentiphaga sp. H8]|nr:hypothetical protein EGT29_14265 [Pigmentiphaga sp. H8]